MAWQTFQGEVSAMSVETVNPSPDAGFAGTAHPRSPRRFLGIGSGQIVAAHIALLLIFIGSSINLIVLAVMVPIAGAIIILGWARMRGRWLSEWLAVWTRHKGRLRHLEQGSDAAMLLSLAHPGSRVSTFDIEAVPAAMIA